MARKKFKIGEAADKLGLTVAVLRRLADQGRIHCTWSRSGQRLFTANAVSAFRRNEYAGSRRRSLAEVEHPMVEEVEIGDDEFPDDEPESLPEDDGPDDEQQGQAIAPAARPVAWPPPPAPSPPVAARPPEPSDDERLAVIKRQAALGMPARLAEASRAKVVQALEREVTAQTCPRWESSVAHTVRAQAVVRRLVKECDAAEAARVQRERAAAQAAREAEEQQAAAAKRRADLIWRGCQYAERHLREIDARDRYDARQDLKAVLEAEVKADWDDADVEDLVDEQVAAWTDGEDDRDD